MTLALLSVESELINSIRWHKSRHHDLPFVIFRRYSPRRDIRTGDKHPLRNKKPLYRLDGKKITDTTEYEIVLCARELFKDIEGAIKKTNGARFGVFQDMTIAAVQRPGWFDYIDGGLFLTWVQTDETSDQRVVECQVMIAGDKNFSEMWDDVVVSLEKLSITAKEQHNEQPKRQETPTRTPPTRATRRAI